MSRNEIPDEELEMFISDITADDWVFMIRPDGTLKAMIVPRMEIGDEINETIIKVFDTIDPKLLDTIMDVTDVLDNEHDLDKAVEEYKKKTKETIH